MTPSRADRLGAAVLLFGLVREPGADALEGSRDSGLLTDEEWDAWRASDDDDTALALACLQAQYEHRRAQWQALDLLLWAYAAPDATPHTDPQPRPDRAAKPGGNAPESPDLVIVPRAVVVTTARAVLGWDHEPPDGG